MRRNIGFVDRMLRFLVGGVIIGIGLYSQSWWGLLGILPFIAAIVGYCLPYALLGVNTTKP